MTFYGFVGTERSIIQAGFISTYSLLRLYSGLFSPLILKEMKTKPLSQLPGSFGGHVSVPAAPNGPLSPEPSVNSSLAHATSRALAWALEGQPPSRGGEKPAGNHQRKGRFQCSWVEGSRGGRGGQESVEGGESHGCVGRPGGN